MRIYIFIVLLSFAFISTSAQVGKRIIVRPHDNNIGALKLYPKKAVTYTNIYVDWNIPAAFTVGIYDSVFNLIKQWQEGPIKNYQKSLTVTQMINGPYYIKVKNAQGELTEKFYVAHN